MQAYKAYSGQPGMSQGATGADYAGSQAQGTGYGLGQPGVAGGLSGQIDPSQTTPTYQPQQSQSPLLTAMMRQNQSQQGY